MSHPTDHDQDNLKKVLRTALVGIRPADQVLLKGYLRILLRLEADLEWVSASHSHVDLFLISNDFRDAASVKKLLSEQAHRPVLYISRADDDEGSMINDELILPLKKIHVLNEWLMTSVAVLKQRAGAVTTILQQHDKVQAAESETVSLHADEVTISAAVPSQSAVTNDRVTTVKSTAQPIENAQTAPPPPAQDTNPVAAAAPRNRGADYQSVIHLIQQLQQRPTGMYEIITRIDNKPHTIAILEPSSSRLWLPEYSEGATLPLSLDWQVQHYYADRPADSKAHDLMQWLWQYAWHHAGVLLPLINDDATYQLRYWVKPVLKSPDQRMGNRQLSSKDRQELLRVMTAIESAPRNVNQLAQFADISVGAAKKVVASLLFSGSLQSDNYVKLDGRIHRIAAEPLPEQAALPAAARAQTATDRTESVTITAPTENVTQPKQTTLEDVLARRARGEASAQTSSSITFSSRMPAQKKPAKPNNQAVPPQQAKSGFLSRLRQKLGIS